MAQNQYFGIYGHIYSVHRALYSGRQVWILSKFSAMAEKNFVFVPDVLAVITATAALLRKPFGGGVVTL